MSGELITSLGPRDWYREASTGYSSETFSVIVPPASPTVEAATAGQVCGLRLQKSYQTTALGFTNPIQEYFNTVFTIPANLTVTTGITVQFRFTDDGTNSADPGTAAVIGVMAYNVDGSSFNVNLGVDGGTEQTGTVTLASTAGQIASLNIAIANAQLASAGAGNSVLLRLRRVGTNASDTCGNSIVLVGTHVKNT
jgi:hypothetical protein